MVAATTTLPPRTEIEDRYKWNAPSVYTSREAWEVDVNQLEAMIADLESYQDRLAQGADVLAEFAEKREKAMRLADKVFFFAAMSQEVDSNDKRATAIVGRAGSLYSRVAAAVSFFNPELIAIGKDTLEKWVAQEPRLKDYGQYLNNLFRQQKHVRSAEVEQVLGLASDPLRAAQQAFDKLTNADMKFPPAVDREGNEHVVSQSTVEALYKRADRELRRTAYESYNGTYLSMKNTLAATYLASVRGDVFQMRVRGFDSSLQAALFSDNIPVEVFHSLIATYKKHLPTWHKYWRVRRKALGVETLQPYDIWAPIAKEQPQLSYEDVVNWICEGMQPLGDDYVNALRKGCLEDRWVDVFPNEGKQQGAFSYGTYDTSPFIMMSFDNGMEGLSTLAHELGHSMHSYLSVTNQPWISHDYTLFAAEVASNFNQAMVRAYLREAKKDDTQFQIALIEEAMSNIHRYFFIMPNLARFEYEVHSRVEKGQGLTADDLIELCADYFSEGYGGEMHVDQGLVGITWATFSHLYANFYPYSYATGISAAHELAKGILRGEEGAAERYLDFLSAGSSMYPVDALKQAGVDMTKPDAVETTFGVLADMVDRLERLIDEA